MIAVVFMKKDLQTIFIINYNPQNEKLHRIKTKSCLAENETSPIKLHPTLAQ